MVAVAEGVFTVAAVRQILKWKHRRKLNLCNPFSDVRRFCSGSVNPALKGILPTDGYYYIIMGTSL